MLQLDQAGRLQQRSPFRSRAIAYVRGIAQQLYALQEGVGQRVLMTERIDDQRVATWRQHTGNFRESLGEPGQVMRSVARAYQIEGAGLEGQ